MPAPAESVAWEYNGSDTLIATITGATIGNFYTMWTFGSNVSGQAVSSTLILTDSSVLGFGDVYPAYVQRGSVAFALTDYLGATLIQTGTAGEYPYPGLTWAFDGVDTVTVTGVFTLGNDVYLTIEDTTGGLNSIQVAATGASQMVSVQTSGALPATGDYFHCEAGEVVGGEVSVLQGNRLFLPGLANSGYPGNPAIAPPACSTLAATNITRTTAQMNGVGNPGGINSVGYFEWGTTVAYGNQTAPQALGAGLLNVAFNAALTDLDWGTLYYYRAVTAAV